MAYDAKKIYYRFDDHLSRLVLDYEASRQISPESENLYYGLPTDPYDEGLFVEHNVKRGLRNADGSGVVAGLTRISDVHGYNKVDGKVVPDQGKLTLRGYSIEDLVNNAQAEDRYGYEEVAYLLITGSLPTKEELDGFCGRLGAFRHLSDEYVREFPMTTVSSSIMNVLQRAVLLLYAFDAEPDAITPEHEIDVAISMLARLPRIAAFAHMASVAKRRGSEVHVPHPTPGLSTAETILQVLRGGMAFTRDEAMLLDVMLMLHAEHGGGVVDHGFGLLRADVDAPAAEDAAVLDDLHPVVYVADGLHGAVLEALIAVFTIGFLDADIPHEHNPSFRSNC